MSLSVVVVVSLATGYLRGSRSRIRTLASRCRAIVRSSSGRVTAHDVDGGALLWECGVGPGVRAARPYSRHPGGARAPLLVDGDRVWTTTFDGVVALDSTTGAVVQRHDVGTEVATVVAVDGGVAGVTADARVVTIPRV